MLRNCLPEFLLISFLLSLNTITSHSISPEQWHHHTFHRMSAIAFNTEVYLCDSHRYDLCHLLLHILAMFFCCVVFVQDISNSLQKWKPKKEN